jgi:hypothetical protein
VAEKPTVTIELTPEQQEQIRKQSGKEIATLKLEALEARLAPRIVLN